NGISISGTIDGTSSTSQALTLAVSGTDTASLLANVGSTVRLGALTISTGNAFSIGPSMTTINASAMTVSGSIPTTLNNTSALTIDTNVPGGSISFGGTINGVTAGVQSLILKADTTISLAANVGTSPTTYLNGFTIGNGGTQFSIGSAMTQIRANSITIGTTPTVLQNGSPFTLNTSDDNGSISFASTIDGASSGAQALTFNPGSGSVTVQGAIGSSTSLGAINITNALNFTASGTVNATSLTQTTGSGLTLFQGALTLSGALSLTGNQFTINAPVSASGATIANGGLLSIGSASYMSYTGNFQQTGGASSQTAGPLISANNISWNASVALLGSTSINWSAVSNITMSGAVNGPNGLTLNAGGVVTFSSTVGSTPLTSLVVNATGGIQVGGNQSVSAGPMTYNGTVTLNTNAIFSNQGVNATTFSTTGTSLTGNQSATLTAPNTSISIYGDVNLSASNGSGLASGNLTATSGTALTVNGKILAVGGSAAVGGTGGNVSLTCTGGSITFNHINTSGGAGTGGGNAGNITIQPAGNYSGGLPVGIIVINSDSSGTSNLVASAGAGTAGSGGIVTLSAARAGPATVATIASSVGGNSITVACDQFIMGPYEAMTALGDIGIAAATSATLGDLVALDSITILAPLANLLIHGDEQILSSTGVLYTSPSLHFLGGSGYMNFATLVPSGPLNAQDLNYSSSFFRPLLLYGDPIVLNFDTSPLPPPSPTPAPTTFASSEFVLYQLSVDDAQLSDLLPIYEVLCPPLYRHKSDRNCRKFL
ncbi:MAG: hypothetical protein KGI83_04415, partial [Verrucomicrobiota bacterium]|nr:hypothetical protein [Verrucomicrobiota bacterium]